MGTPITIPVLILPIPSGFFGIWGLSGFNIIILPSGGGFYLETCEFTVSRLSIFH